jgi:tRNA uridine 5-carboxymethylaminomethyl modification enzyme
MSLHQIKTLDTEIEKTFNQFPEEVLEQVEILTKYETYLQKEKQLAERVGGLENYSIPEKINYDNINAMSTEAREKLKKIKPQTLGQASRISGVSPSDISIIMVYLGK